MSTIFDDKLPTKVYDLATVKRAAMDVTVVTDDLSTPGAYDPATGTVTETAITHTGVKMFPPGRVRQRYIEAGVATAKDTQATFPALNLGFTPHNGMKITIAGVDYRALHVDTFRTGDSIAAYRVVMRQGE